MKSISIILFLTLGLSASVFASKTLNFIGTWKFAKIEYKGEFIDKNQPESSKKVLLKMMNENDQATTEKEIESGFDMFMVFFEMIQYTFEKKGTMTLIESKGVYSLKGNILTIKMDDSKEEINYKIEIKNNFLLLQDMKESNSILYLTKE
jgi:hypothetical protein